MTYDFFTDFRGTIVRIGDIVAYAGRGDTGVGRAYGGYKNRGKAELRLCVVKNIVRTSRISNQSVKITLRRDDNGHVFGTSDPGKIAKVG